MLKNIKNSRIIIYQLFGFSVFISLITISWAITSRHLEEHVMLNASMRSALEKMRVISKLTETSRNRTRLSHSMLLTDDVIEKNEISVQISSLAGEFIQSHNKLISLPLNEQEKVILDSLVPLYPQVIENLETVSQLALEDTNRADQRARNIIIRQIVPMQGKVIDGFNLLIRIIEKEAYSNSLALSEKYQRKQKTRLILLLSILFVSIVTIFFVVINVHKIETKLRALSTTDELTGILNRRSFNSMLQDAWKSALRSNTPLTAMLIDIDFFKKYNDFYGHQEGDRCLFKVANIIRSIVSRSGDIVARYGGEEFAVILPNVDESGAKIVAERLLNQVRKEHIPHIVSETKRQVTISIGYTCMIPTQDNSVEKLIKAADDGLYESKKAGKDRASLVKFGELNLG
ncbi:MAG: GGDEF domain-containing protein [Gammaproteobacteria bacterium]|nr:MAG: GGDEF domain-containing protein [Gammaproteobacteria bacterium]